jgi:hypothetical protein
MIESKPKFLQGVFPFHGAGYGSPLPISETLDYTVPATKRAQLIYFRGGNSALDMVCVVLMRDGTPIRYFPISGAGAVHVPLAVVEDLEPDTLVTLGLAAPNGAVGTLIVDVGLIEI